MRVRVSRTVFLAMALSSPAFAASNSAHVCGDRRLSAPDQTTCRAQMDAARTEGERLRVQGSFEKLSASVTGEASTAQRNAAKTLSPGTHPQTNPSTTPSDSYPPAEAKPPVYPGEVPDPKTGKPPA
jgi:hypothetical protein